MDISGKQVWQLAAGDTDRDYSDLFLKWDVIAMGPGYAGPWPGCVARLTEDGCKRPKINDLGRFCEEIRDGDVVVLRLGTWKVLGVGIVVGQYDYRDEFCDVDGWDLQHIRRVRWVWEGHKEFDTYSMKFGSTSSLLGVGSITEWIESLDVSDELADRSLAQLPEVGKTSAVSLGSISEYLFDHGVASASIARLLEGIGELVRIAGWYKRTSMPSEHETVAYLVVPLLRALGWTPQRMAVEWNRVDLALFESLPRSDESLSVVVEVKRMDASCLSAVSQAQSYAENRERCDRLIVSDGLRYGVYVRSERREFGLHAYMNLTDLRSGYPIHNCYGAREAILAMSPEWGKANPVRP